MSLRLLVVGTGGRMGRRIVALGVETGDFQLVGAIELAGRIKSTIRGEDTVSRQGGDEFIVVGVLVQRCQELQRPSTRWWKVLELR